MTAVPERAVANNIRKRQADSLSSLEQEVMLPKGSGDSTLPIPDACHAAQSSTSNGFPRKNSVLPSVDSFDRVFASLDEVKQQVHRMRQDQMETITPPVVTDIASPAMALQQHFQNLPKGTTTSAGMVLRDQTVDVDPDHFPALDHSSPGSADDDNQPGLARRCTYASVLALDTMKPKPTSPDAQRHSDGTEDEDALTMPSKPRDIGILAKNSAAKQRFAQPTQSFSRRAGKTLREKQAAVSQKSTPESSPKKSVRVQEPHLATSGRAAQRQQKRMSLPDDWVKKPRKEASTTPTSLPPSPTKSHPHEPSLKKKKSTYMSPTKATSRRIVVPSEQDGSVQSGGHIGRTSPTSGILPFPAFITTSPSKKVPSSTIAKKGLKSPTKIPRFSAGGASLAQHGGSSMPVLPQVANTTTRRRTSHADILQPILNRLDNQGLRKDRPSETRIPGVQAADKMAERYRPRNWSDARSVATGSRSSRQNSIASTLLSPVIITQRQGLAQLPADALCLKDEVAIGATGEDSPQKKQVGSLRATAQEFKPIWKPETAGQELGLLSWQGELDYRDEGDWHAMPHHVRQSISTLRDYKRVGATASSSRSTPRSASPSKRAERAFYAELSRIPTSDKTGSVQAGQILRPTLSPGKKTVRWSVEETDGSQRMIHFGRAPAPPAPKQVEIASLSPTSLDSAVTTISSADDQAWTIAPSYTNGWQYGWKGGDGKEISFAGCGPQAESDPNSPVRMRIGGMTARFDDNKENAASIVPKVWPRSRRQWAELAGYSKIPCGNVQYVGAVEQIPGTYPGFGVCEDCTTDVVA